MELNKKTVALLNILKDVKTWTTCSCLAKKLNTTPRSIRYIISKINSENEIIISSNKGYLLKKEGSSVLNNSYSDSIIPSNYNERRKYIFEQLAIFNKSLNMDETSAFFCISPITFKNELLTLRKELSNYNLHLKSKNGNMYVIGNEKDRQKFALSLIKDELEYSYFSLSKIQQYFKLVDLDAIRQIVLNVFTKYQYFLDDYSLLNYVLHLAVCIEIRCSHTANTNQDLDIVDNDIIKIVQEITGMLNENYGTAFTSDDIMGASLLMTTRISSQTSSYVDFDNIKQYVGEEISDLMVDIINSVYDTYSIDLNNDKFTFRFAQHIKNLLIRAQNGLSIKNGQFINIKNEYPFLYVIAVYVSYIITKRTQYELSEDEIAYLALHIGVMIEEKTVQEEKLSCVIVATDYYTIGRNLFKKINRRFYDSLFVQNVTTNYSQISDETGIDLVISTYELNNINLPTLIVGPFLAESEIPNLCSKIETLKQQKRNNNILSKIEIFLREDLCFFDRGFKTAEDAIEVICDYMIEKNYVHSSFKNDIYAHERISPSSYGNIAVAHTLTNNDLHSLISLSVNPTPIIWGSNAVNIVFIISLNRKDGKLFKDIFRFLTEIVSKEQAFSMLMDAKNYNDLINILRFHI